MDVLEMTLWTLLGDTVVTTGQMTTGLVADQKTDKGRHKNPAASAELIPAISLFVVGI